MKPKVKWYKLGWRTIALCLLIIVTFCSYVGWRIYGALHVRPMGEGPAGPPIAAEPFKTEWSNQEIMFLGVGDSITRGYGAPAGLIYFDLLVRNHPRYPNMNGNDLSSVFPNFKSRNIAVDFTVSQQHIDSQLVKIPKYGSHVRGVIVLTSGGNDLIHDYGRSKPRHDAMYGCTYKQAKEWCELDAQA